MLAGAVSVRLRNGKQENGVPLQDFIASVRQTVEHKEQI